MLPTKEKINEEEYKGLLGGSVCYVKKVRHELDYEQNGVGFKLKYDESVGSSLRVLEVDAKTDDERATFGAASFPGELF